MNPGLCEFNLPTGSWMTTDEELSQRVHQTMGATKSILRVFFNSKEFARVDLLPSDKFFTAVYFVNKGILPLDNRYTQQLGDIGRHNLHLHFDNSKCHTAPHVQEQMASRRCALFPTARIHATWPSQTSTCLAG
jgi:hypothetical protein